MHRAPSWTILQTMQRWKNRANFPLKESTKISSFINRIWKHVGSNQQDVCQLSIAIRIEIEITSIIKNIRGNVSSANNEHKNK